MIRKHKRLIATILTVSILTSFNVPRVSFANPISEVSISNNKVATDGIEINNTNFPDTKFLDYVKSNFDTNQDNKLSKEEIEKVRYIYVNMKGIKNLKGIEYFTNLKYLYVEMNYLTELDLSQNKELVVVYANNNMLTSIKLPNEEANNNLELLYIYDNRITEINLKNLNKLKFLDIGNNLLTNLDLSGNPLGDAHGFIASYNNLAQITLPNNNYSYDLNEFLSTQNYPKGKEEGYEIKWYLDKEKTKLIDTSIPIICNGQTIYSEFKPITYTIEFHPGSGEGKVKTQDFEYGTAENLLKNEFTKTNYYFAGWKDENGKIYKDSQEVINLTYKNGKVIKLTATWNEVDYTGQEYTIDLYDGDRKVDTIKGNYGTPVQLPKNQLIKEGYDFMGWNFGFGNEGIFSDGGKVLITHPDDLNGSNNTLNLYTAWKEKEFTVNFIDTENNQKKIVKYNEHVILPENPKKEGYIFEGWITESGDKWNEETRIIENVNLYAKYSPIKYSVSFNGNGADNEEAMNNETLQMDYSEQAVLPDNMYEKNNYELKGWSTSQNGNVEFADNDVIYQLTTENNKNITLYAVWEKNLADSTINIKTESLNKIYNGKVVENPSVEKTGSTSEVAFTWYQRNGLEWKEIASAPSNVGQYKVVATLPADESYKMASTEKEFTISKATNSWKTQPSIQGWKQGEKAKTPVGQAAFGVVKFTYSNAENGIFTTTVPTQAGTWYMKATVEGNENYTGLEKAVSFVIEKANVNKNENSWKIEPSIQGWKEGEKAKTPAGQAAFGVVKFTYSNAKNGIFTTTVPTQAGTWYMKATVEGNENYTGLEKVVSFVIEKANINNGQNISKPQVNVVAGAKRYDTAVELSKSKFTKADTVVIVGGYALVDGLTATPIATSYNSPILLVEKNNIPEVTKNEIKRLGAKNVIIVGGTGAINTNVENQLKSLGVSNITRLGGKDRYETSLLVAKYIDSKIYDVENIVVTNGFGEADALSISPVAGRDKMPIILTRSNNIPTSIKNWISGEGIKNAYIIGGKGVVDDNVLNEVNKMTSNDISSNRIGGSTRYETNALIIDKFYGQSTNKAYVSKGFELIDALSSGPIAALENSPVVLAGNDLTKTQKDVISKRNIKIVVQAGHGISNKVTESLMDVLTLK